MSLLALAQAAVADAGVQLAQAAARITSEPAAATLPPWLQALLGATLLASLVSAFMTWWGWQKQGDLEVVKMDIHRLSQQRTSFEQKRAEVAAETMGASLRFLSAMRFPGRMPRPPFGGPTRFEDIPNGAEVAIQWRTFTVDTRDRFEKAWDMSRAYLDDGANEYLWRVWSLYESRMERQQEYLMELTRDFSYKHPPGDDDELFLAKVETLRAEAKDHFRRYVQLADALAGPATGKAL